MDHKGIFIEKMQKGKKIPRYEEIPFMNTIRKRVFNKYPNAEIVYGSWTTPNRKELGLEKSHYNDALTISGIDNMARKGIKNPNREAKRNNKNTKQKNGIYLNDKVRIFNKTGFISGFAKNEIYVKDIEGNYIMKPNKNYKQISYKDLEFIHHNNNWQFIS